MAGSAPSPESTSSWFVKTVRSGARYPDGTLPPEVWQAGGVCPTLNTGDNTGESRATILVQQAVPVAVRGRGDAGTQAEVGAPGDPARSVRSSNGFDGGGMVLTQAVPVDLRNVAREGGTGVGTPGTGIGEAGDPSYTLTAANRAVPGVITVSGRDVTHTLTADGSDGSDGSEDGTGRGTPIVAFSHTAGLDCQPSEDVTPTVLAGNNRMPADSGHAVVRRLTPLECERLQGFPDGHTDVPGATDSPRYKQMGNAVTVNVFEWVTARIVAAEVALQADGT